MHVIQTYSDVPVVGAPMGGMLDPALVKQWALALLKAHETDILTWVTTEEKVLLDELLTKLSG
jgi:hypothetical protein